MKIWLEIFKQLVS